MVGGDQIVGGIGKEGMAFTGSGPLAAGSDDEMNFGVAGEAASNAASSRTARYSRTERLASSLASHSAPGTERCLLASVAMRLASAAKRSLPTSPCARQRSTTVSNRCRRMSLCRSRLTSHRRPILRKSFRELNQAYRASTTGSFSTVYRRKADTQATGYERVVFLVCAAEVKFSILEHCRSVAP